MGPRTGGVTYPKVGVIDTGMAAPLDAWVLSVHDFIGQADLEPAHGTFIGGLLTGGRGLNPGIPGLEADGCDLVDIPLFPKKELFGSFYPNGFADFLDEMDNAVEEAVAGHGVRVFNLSINAVQPVSGASYSYYAERLDEIAARHDVVVVNSAGNLPAAGKSWRYPDMSSSNSPSAAVRAVGSPSTNASSADSSRFSAAPRRFFCTSSALRSIFVSAARLLGTPKPNSSLVINWSIRQSRFGIGFSKISDAVAFQRTTDTSPPSARASWAVTGLWVVAMNCTLGKWRNAGVDRAATADGDEDLSRPRGR